MAQVMQCLHNTAAKLALPWELVYFLTSAASCFKLQKGMSSPLHIGVDMALPTEHGASETPYFWPFPCLQGNMDVQHDCLEISFHSMIVSFYTSFKFVTPTGITVASQSPRQCIALPAGMPGRTRGKRQKWLSAREENRLRQLRWRVQ